MTSSYLNLLKKIFIKTCYSKEYRINLSIALFFLSIGIISNVSLPLIFKKVIDDLIYQETPMASFLLIGYGILWTLCHSSDSLREIFMNRIIERSSRLLNAHLFQKLYLLPEKFYVEQKIGSITNIINRAQKSLPIILWTVILHIIPVIIEFLCVGYILLQRYDFQHVIILVGTIVSFVIYTFFGTKIALKAREKTIESEKIVDSKLIDWVKNIELVRTFGKSRDAFRDYNKSLKIKEITEVKYLTIFCTLRFGQTVLLGIGLSVMTYCLGLAVRKGTLSIGDFVLFNAYFIQFIGPIGILGYAFKDIKKAVLEMRDVIKILDKVPVHKKNLHTLTGSNFQIEFKNVSFSYGGKVVLNNLSFVIQPGEIAVLIGETGSGKSTILKLLTRSYEPDEGSIYINGISIDDICLYSLRKIIGIVPQDNALIDTTIKNNILFFNEEKNHSQFKIATKNAHIWESIQKLPDHFDTMVGENGSRLSGGEKQRICLARLFFSHSGICLFDEPTSALDEKTETIIYQNIQKYLKKSTRVIITHRPSFIHKADKVIYLNKK